jgi:hypothetical protein
VAKYPSHIPGTVLAMGIRGKHLVKGECTMPGPFDKMVCLVGENPLPVYLGIKQLATPEAEVILVYSEATRPQAQNIQGLLEKARKANGNRGRTCIMNQVVLLRDPFTPRQVRETLDAVVARLNNPRAYALNYTGGTKVMSTYGLLAWILIQQAPQRKGRSAGMAWPEVKNAFYLEEPSAKFHFHDDEVRLMVAPTLEELLSLHGVNHLPERIRPDISEHDTQKMFSWFFDNNKPFNAIRKSVNWGELLTKDPTQQYEWLLSQYNQALGEWQADCPWRKLLSLITNDTAQRWLDGPELPGDRKAYQGSLMEARFRFIVYGLWFELWVRDILQKLLGPQQEIFTGAELTIEGQRFESDVMTIVDHRPFYFSVTTASREGTCKEKMFEAMHRARQIGGGLAYSCVVSLAEYTRYGGQANDTVQNCRRSIGKEPYHTMFGKAHVRQWQKGSHNSLRRFLQGIHRLQDRL